MDKIKASTLIKLIENIEDYGLEAVYVNDEKVSSGMNIPEFNDSEYADYYVESIAVNMDDNNPEYPGPYYELFLSK